jgi:2-methylcitrate dehydratase PrpD
MAEREQAGGTALLRAVALGYDIGTRMSLALGSYEFSRAGHGTHTFGPMFGAAAACASLARLNAEQVRYVLSYTTQQAGGLSNYARDTEHVEKAFQFGGLPARNGAASATMVASGMTGIDDAFSGERNFFFAFGPKTNPEELTRALGETYEVVNTNIKRWTVGSPIQAPLDSLYELMTVNKFKADDVDHVVVRISHQGRATVNDRSMPDINLQYMVAVMLIDGTATLEAAHDFKRMQDPNVLELRKRVELVGDDALERALPSRQAIVEVTLRDGRVLRHHTEEVRGTSANPMTREEVGEKAFGLCAPVLGKKRAHELVAAIWRIEEVNNLRSLRYLLQA